MMRSDAMIKADGKPAVLPFYLLVDVSGSMAQDMPELNQAVLDFRDELAKHAVLADKVRFSVIDFSDDAGLVLPLCDLTEATLPVLSSRGGTSYAAGFRKVREVIDADFEAAKPQVFQLFRPAVFFLTDGYPNPGDGWEGPFHDLTFYDKNTGAGFKRYPLFVPFGFRDANAKLLSGLVHPLERSRLYIANQGATVATVLQEMAKAMILSVVSSGMSAYSGAPQHVLPSQQQLGPSITAYDGGDFPG